MSELTLTVDDPPATTWEASARWRWAARCAVVTPIVVAVVRALVNGWFPVGDDALLAVRAYDVGTAHHPWLGSWTSASLVVGTDVNNPGPLYYELVAPFMWTIGRIWSIGAATAVGVGAINAAVAIGVMSLGGRLGGWRFERWTMLMVALLTWSMGSELLIDIWQPHALLLPFCALLLLTVGLLVGDLRLLPWWILAASLVLQTHVAYVYIVGALGLIGVVAVVRWWGRHRPSAREVARRPIVWWAVGVAVVCWIQPVIEQLFGPGRGNLARLASAAGGGDVTVGVRQGVKVVAAVTAVPPGWTRFGFADAVQLGPLVDDGGRTVVAIPGLPSTAVTAGALLVLAAALAALLAWAVRAGRTLEAAVLAVGAVAFVVALVGVSSQTVGLTGFGNHQVRWLFAMAVYLHVVMAWAAVEWWTARRPGVERFVEWAVPAIVAVVTVANLPMYAQPLGPTADRAAADTLRHTFDDLSGLADLTAGGALLFDTTNTRVYEPYSSAIIMRLRELGVEVRFDNALVRQYGENRRADGGEVGTLRQYEGPDALLYDGPGCVISLRSADGSALDGDQPIVAVIEHATDDLTGAPIVTEGLAPDVEAMALAAAAGDRSAAYRLVASDLVPVLVDEGRVTPTPALEAAIAARTEIVAAVNATLAVVLDPAELCP